MGGVRVSLVFTFGPKPHGMEGGKTSDSSSLTLKRPTNQEIVIEGGFKC